MKWSDLGCGDFYITHDENRKAIKGYWLISQGIDLNCIPPIFQCPVEHIKRTRKEPCRIEEKKVYLHEIIGTAHQDYGNMSIIEAYIRLKRGCGYINHGSVTKRKYSRLLKTPVTEQDVAVILAEHSPNQYFVSRNGNHRVIFYKMMMLAEILRQENNLSDEYYPNMILTSPLCKKHWITAQVEIFNSDKQSRNAVF